MMVVLWAAWRALLLVLQMAGMKEYHWAGKMAVKWDHTMGEQRLPHQCSLSKRHSLSEEAMQSSVSLGE